MTFTVHHEILLPVTAQIVMIPEDAELLGVHVVERERPRVYVIKDRRDHQTSRMTREEVSALCSVDPEGNTGRTEVELALKDLGMDLVDVEDGGRGPVSDLYFKTDPSANDERKPVVLVSVPTGREMTITPKFLKKELGKKVWKDVLAYVERTYDASLVDDNDKELDVYAEGTVIFPADTTRSGNVAVFSFFSVDLSDLTE